MQKNIVNIKKVLIFGDAFGITQIKDRLPKKSKLEVRTVAASIRDIPETIHIDYIQPQKQQKAEYYDFFYNISKFNLDIIFSNSYSMYISPEILHIPKYGAINIHYSMLPKYRGANPIQWAMINGEYYVGVTIHYMTERIDAGDIITQQLIVICPEDTWVNVVERCKRISDLMITTEIPKIFDGTNKRTKQDERFATYYPRRTPEDGEIIWTMPTIDIYNKIRALVKPHPGVFYTDKSGNKIVITDMKPYDWVKEQRIKMLIP